MNSCLFCYKELKENQIDFHPACSRQFFGTDTPPSLPYQLEEMEVLAKEAVAQSVTVPGVQPKLSLGWLKNLLDDGHIGRLTIMDALQGQYILKPPNPEYSQMPENEHLSMMLAALFRINLVPFSLIRLASGELAYITKRIDRNNDGSKIHMIDFLQILELEDKYKGTMERLGKEIGELSANMLYDKLRFFELTVFNYIIGNNDMHLKNFSMWMTEVGWELAPAYDLLNVKLILPNDREDTALNLGGKKFNFSKNYFDRFGEGLQLNEKQIQVVYRNIAKWYPKALELIDISFLNEDNKIAYKTLISERITTFKD